MKNIFTKIFATVAFIGALIYSNFAATVTYGPNLLTGTNHNFFTNGIYISKVTVVATNLGTAGAIVWLYDSATNSYLLPYGPLTNATLYATNLITTYTNIAGATESQTNQYLVRVQNVLARQTNAFRLVTAVNVGTNGTWVYEPVNPLNAFAGLTMTNSVSIQSLTLEYAPIK